MTSVGHSRNEVIAYATKYCDKYFYFMTTCSYTFAHLKIGWSATKMPCTKLTNLNVNIRK